MRWLLLISVLIFMVSCNGEVEEGFKNNYKPIILKIEPIDIPVEVVEVIPVDDRSEALSKKLDSQQKTITKLVSDLSKIKKVSSHVEKPVKQMPIKQLLKDKLFRHTGHFGGGTNCRGKIYRKDFRKSRTYLNVDSYGNYTTQQVWRK